MIKKIFYATPVYAVHSWTIIFPPPNFHFNRKEFEDLTLAFIQKKPDDLDDCPCRNPAAYFKEAF